jgi:hypothetical protein
MVLFAYIRHSNAVVYAKSILTGWRQIIAGINYVIDEVKQFAHSEQC